MLSMLSIDFQLKYRSTHLCVDTGTAQLVFDYHHDDPEHAHDQGVVADALALLEECFPLSQAIAHIGFVFGRVC